MYPARSSTVRAPSLYLGGSWFESKRADFLKIPLSPYGKRGIFLCTFTLHIRAGALSISSPSLLNYAQYFVAYAPQVQFSTSSLSFGRTFGLLASVFRRLHSSTTSFSNSSFSIVSFSMRTLAILSKSFRRLVKIS